MAKQLTEDELDIRRKQRRRLVGAVALTLVVVVVLPMVLDNEPKSSLPDIDLRIPDPDQVGEFVPRVAIPDSALAPSKSSQLPESGKASEVAPQVKTTQPVAPAIKMPPQAKNSKNEQSAKTVTTVPAVKPVVPKPIEPKPSGDSAGFAAQIGAYSNADAAKQELVKLKNWGFKAYIEKVGDITRVRVGPYPSREKAEQIGLMLEKHGLHPVILSAK